MLILQAHTGPLQRDGQEAGQQSLGPEHHQVLREQQERVVRAGTFSGETWKSASGPTAGRGFFSPEQVPNLGPIPGLSHGGGDEAAARARVRCVGLHRRLGRLLPDLCGTRLSFCSVRAGMSSARQSWETGCPATPG